MIILLHWSVLMAVLVMIKGGTANETVRWAFVGMGAVWAGLALVKGLLGKPGPKLQGTARAIYRPMHIGLYVLLGGAVVINGAELLGLIAPGGAWISLLVLLTAGTFHGLFHFWRHTALYDGAFRVMMPRPLHKYL
ncbi:hypothetical protein [Flavimaricola marinus]|uniref:hypothetical protein n=1 Tax=Flavimaricola marinus TaxID=1819565 RepID=UPI001FE8C1B8|nr:hypothetical protein [Flavimaricola marinus]